MPDTNNSDDNIQLNKAIFKEWLEKLQQESWQLELIISGFALFGIYQSRGLISDLEIYNFDATNNIFADALESLVSIGWRIFFINLLVHVILRSLWIGAIGLRYVSGEINYKELNYSEHFTKYLIRRVGDYDEFIERLERICSVLFSYTFLLFLFFLSALAFGIFSFIPLIIIDALGGEVEENLVLFLIWFFPYLFGGAIVLIDFITLGGIKRIKDRTVSKIYMPIYWFYSHITLSFLYRPLLYNFIDDKYTRRFFFFSFPYIFVIANFTNFYTNEQTPYIPEYSSLREQGLIVNPYYYDDLYSQKLNAMLDDERRSARKLGALRLSNYKVSEPYLQLFIKYNSRYENVIKHKHGVTPIYKSGWKFTLFSDIGKERDTVLYALKDSFKVHERKVYNEYKIYRDSVKVTKEDTILKRELITVRDSLKRLRKSMTDKRNKALKEMTLNKEEKILRLLKKQADITLNGIAIDDSISCHFSVHHLLGDEGVMYTIPVSNLPLGDHELGIALDRSYIEKKDSVVTWNYILPFLKIK